MKENLKIGVIGLGKMGLLHAGILNVLPHVQLSAICDKSARIIRFARKVFDGVHIVDDLRKLAHLNLDAVYITTPIPSHFSIAKFIYSNEIAPNLFIEKTLATSYDEAVELCRSAQSSDGINIVGYMDRFAVTFKKAKELLEQKVIGEVLSFEAYAYSSDFIGIKKGSSARGGVLRDLASHIIDIALWYFGDFQVETAKLEFLIQAGSEDTAYFKVKGPNGLEGKFNVSWFKEGYRSPEFGLKVTGFKGTVKVDNDSLTIEMDNGSSFTWHRHDLNDNVAFLMGAPEYFREDEHFIKAILERQNAEPSFYTASKVESLIDQVKYKAHRT